ncbi:tail fiber protein [Methylobacterium isbiliense]|uniref:Phage tail collar domain-containing protein n=1 Tax=Methylobacterium isbiliense TaxID=315478 RepID=A0ABQ4SFR1_9HYPH|nr:tail fiber protein [Methylobacterium isbiliense]MDN3627423.1 phage tail protein [Methylobacterium isbiliense]GJE00650.1 hypothetical protein GMJLKIPL_2574 [Methylobacterium isbiliense]
MPNLTKWSTDPGSNDLVDVACPWPEGMPRPQVNDSARGMMASVACWLADTTGGLVLGGGPLAYTVATNQDIDALSARVTIAFTVTTANAGPATLSLNGLPAKPIRRRFNRGLGPQDLTPGVVYRAAFVPGLDAFLILSPEIERPGALRAQADAIEDPGWLLADGRAVSRAAYAALFAHIGTTYGAGDGSSTFNLPDLRGRTLFGADAQGGAPANRLTGAGGVGGGLGSSGGLDAAALTSGQMPSHSHAATMSDAGGLGSGTTGAAGGHDHGGLTTPAGSHSHPAIATNAGTHAHTGNAAPNGAHAHDVQNLRIGAPGGSAALFVSSIGPGGANTVAPTESGGLHGHGLTIDPAGEHSHPVTIDPAPNHQHGVPAIPDHTHTFPGTPPHTHALTIEAAGGTAPVSRMPPSLVVAIAIKA